MRSRKTSTSFKGCGLKKSWGCKLIRLLMDDGRASMSGRELSMVAGRSCTVSLRLGNASASAILAWPLEPPTYTD